MTSSVKISAHCSSDREVVVDLCTLTACRQYRVEGEHHVLQDGETLELHVYDDRTVSVTEQTKGEKV